MHLNPAVFDLWTFRRANTGIEYLLFRTSEFKAERFFNGGRFWQIPSGVFRNDETVPASLDRRLAEHCLSAKSLWAAEHAYTIYNRRFNEIQIVTVYAAEVDAAAPQLDPDEHSEYRWLPFDAALDAVHFRGLKDGLRSVREYITGVKLPAAELCLRSENSSA